MSAYVEYPFLGQSEVEVKETDFPRKCHRYISRSYQRLDDGQRETDWMEVLYRT